MKELNNQKTCEKCYYYSQHYSKQGVRYDTVCCGHCTHRQVKKFKVHSVCEFWETIETKKKERKQSIQNLLRHMSEQLHEISLILKDDAEILQ